MVFINEDKVLTNSVYKLKGYNSKIQVTTQFGD